MTQVILGTAGHIDHGKTALIKALTGIDLDRLKEEKERGITIELGFASLALSPEQKIGVVDVPGHEKFIKRMVAGAGGVDIVILIVAADDGIMPQTKEHFDICQLLDINHGLIALTKIDLVEPEWVELVTEDITRLVKGTFLEGAPVIPVSSVTGEGIPRFLSALKDIVPKIHQKSSDGLCFLPIDRIFTMKGFGTVVTGTLISGKVRVGENLEILPAGIRAKARGIQVYNEAVESSLAGQRTAINVQGAEKHSFTRGDILSHPDTLKASFRFDVRLRLLSDTDHPLKHGAEIRLHLYTAQTMARVISYEGNVLEPGGAHYVQLRLSDPLVSIPGARFIIRNPEATCTIGGGTILDPHPPRHRRSDPNTKTWFQILQGKKLEPIITTIAKESGVRGITKKELFRRVDAPLMHIEKTWKQLLETGVLREINPEAHQSIHGETLVSYERNLQTLLKQYHVQNPLKSGIPLEEAKQRLGLDISEKFFECLIQEMEKKGEVGINGDTVHHISHKISLNPEEMEIKSHLEAVLISQGLTPPTLRELEAQLSASQNKIKNLLTVSVKEGMVVKVKEDLYFAKDNVEGLKKILVEFLKIQKEITPGDFKEMTGVSRKYSIPLLEYFDREKVTMRVGDKRLLRERKTLG